MKKIIQNMLEMTGEIYETRVLENFFLWCNLNSIDDVDCQKLLANASLFNWWYRQYTNLEEKFIRRHVAHWGKVDKQVLRAQYNETVIAIKHYYSRPLIAQARHHKPVTPQLN